MLSRALIMVTVAAAAVAFVFQSPPAAIAAAVVGMLAFTSRGFDR